MSTYEIREMIPEDIPRTAEIESMSICPPWSRKSFEDALTLPDTLMVTVLEEEKVVGYVVMYISFEEGEITNVAVDPAYRRKGIAALLMEKTAEKAKARGVERVILEVRASNSPAIRLYEKCGFRTLGRRRHFYTQPDEDAIIMEWNIC